MPDYGHDTISTRPCFSDKSLSHSTSLSLCLHIAPSSLILCQSGFSRYRYISISSGSWRYTRYTSKRTFGNKIGKFLGHFIIEIIHNSIKYSFLESSIKCQYTLTAFSSRPIFSNTYCCFFDDILCCIVIIKMVSWSSWSLTNSFTWRFSLSERSPKDAYISAFFSCSFTLKTTLSSLSGLTLGRKSTPFDFAQPLLCLYNYWKTSVLERCFIWRKDFKTVEGGVKDKLPFFCSLSANST